MLAYMPLIRVRYLSTDVENLGFFSALSTLYRRQGGKPLTNKPLDDPSLETVDPTSSPIFGGPPLYRESCVHISGPC